MQPHYIADAVALAKRFVATADFIDQHYDIYRDGRGDAHYVNGPACKQLRDISMQLSYVLSDLRRGTASTLPAMPEATIPADATTLNRHSWREAHVIRTK